jgi:dTDP-glucose 4,6-dehydratase
VTGGAGFIGSEFVRQTAGKDYKVTVLDSLTYAGDLQRLAEVKDKITFIKGDICDQEVIRSLFSGNRFDIIAHFAAESHVDRSILDSSVFVDTNIKGTNNLLDAAKKSGIEKFLYVSTDEVYGHLGEDGQFFETTSFAPNSPYSASKASADLLVRAFHKTHALPVLTVRPSNNYGPWQYPEKLIPVIIYKAMKGEKIPVYGSGMNVREWLYTNDCVSGIFSVIEKGRIGEAYNIGSGNERRNIEVVKTVLGIMGKSEDLIEYVSDRPGHDFRYSLNTDKIRGELGWKPEVSFSKGMEMTTNWYLANMDWVEEKVRYLGDYWERIYRK